LNKIVSTSLLKSKTNASTPTNNNKIINTINTINSNTTNSIVNTTKSKSVTNLQDNNENQENQHEINKIKVNKTITKKIKTQTASSASSVKSISVKMPKKKAKKKPDNYNFIPSNTVFKKRPVNEDLDFQFKESLISMDIAWRKKVKPLVEINERDEEIDLNLNYKSYLDKNDKKNKILVHQNLARIEKTKQKAFEQIEHVFMKTHFPEAYSNDNFFLHIMHKYDRNKIIDKFVANVGPFLGKKLSTNLSKEEDNEIKPEVKAVEAIVAKDYNHVVKDVDNNKTEERVEIKENNTEATNDLLLPIRCNLYLNNISY